MHRDVAVVRAAAGDRQGRVAQHLNEIAIARCLVLNEQMRRRSTKSHDTACDSIRRLLLLALLLLPLGARPGSAADADWDELFSYRIEHERWGEIGSLSNQIYRNGTTTRIETRMRIAVRFLFMVVYREETDRTEVWNSDRLIGYDAETDLNGEIIRISGRAEDGVFKIAGAGGTVAAPPDVIPTNPWSGFVRHAKTVMGTTRGLVVPVNVGIQEGVPLTLANREVTTSHLMVTPLTDPGLMPFPQEIWFDANDIPVAFAVTKDGQRTTFRMSNYGQALAARKKRPQRTE